MENAKTPDKTLEAENPDGKTLKAGNFKTMELLGQATGSCPEKCGAVESQSEALPEGNGEKLIVGNGVCEGEEFESGDLTSVVVPQVVNGGHALEVEKVSSLRDCADGEFESEEHLRDRVLQKEDDSLAIDGVDTGSNVNVSGNNISLYVELPVPLDQTGYPKDMNCVGSTKDLAKKECEEEPIERFCVGDVVWVRTKNQSWRPGKICGDSNATICSKEGQRINCHVVQYFGASHVTWCPPSDLRHFHDNFDKMVEGNKGRNLTGAVEKAMDEYVKCLKSEINSSCMVKQEDGGSGKECKHLQEFRFSESVTKFEPMIFLSRVKQLAVAVSKPSMLELALAKIRVEAFSCFRGHLQVHLDELWEQSPKKRNGGKTGSITTKVNGNALVGDQNSTQIQGTSAGLKETLGQSGQESRSRKRKRNQFFEINFRREDLGEDLPTSPSTKEAGNLGSPSTADNQSSDMRERKRSKYLSYPYVNLEHKNNRPDEKEKPKVPEMEVMRGVSSEDVVGLSGASSISSSKRFQKQWFENFIKDTSISSKPEFLGASVSNLLSELSCASVDCLYQSKSKNFAIVEWFFSRFRISAFHDESIYEMHCKNTTGDNAAEIQTPPGKVAEETSQTLPPKQAWKKMNESENSAITNVEVATNGMAADTNCCVVILPSSDKGLVHNNGSEEQGTFMLRQEIDQISNIPDLNSNGGVVPNLLSLSPQAVTKIQEKATLPVVNGNVSEAGTLSECLQGRGPFSPSHLPGEGKVTCSPTSISDTNGKLISFGSSTWDPPLTSCDTVKVEGKLVPKKRKREETPVSEQVISAAAGISDLNGGLNAENGTSANLGVKRGRGRGRGRGGNPGRPTKKYAPSVPFEKYSRKWFHGEPPKEPESRPLHNPGAPPQVFFPKAADGDKSFRSSLEKGNNPFGGAPVSSQLLPIAVSPTSHSKGELNTTGMPAAPKAAVAPPIDVIRQNLAMMTSMLQKSGDGLSPEMRSKLENEINSLMKKVSSMPKSSSTSS
ncbi:unnamed protein product [Linum trigynum]|uniref:PWWP domain-containing protein n=1 Tax=Linum trigynum TaxID=586398 RepID=A0AAV2D761_9ROSI